jgi:hypothetical protein
MGEGLEEVGKERIYRKFGRPKASRLRIGLLFL